VGWSGRYATTLDFFAMAAGPVLLGALVRGTLRPASPGGSAAVLALVGCPRSHC
jgi:hypothetical protein